MEHVKVNTSSAICSARMTEQDDHASSFNMGPKDLLKSADAIKGVSSEDGPASQRSSLGESYVMTYTNVGDDGSEREDQSVESPHTTSRQQLDGTADFLKRINYGTVQNQIQRIMTGTRPWTSGDDSSSISRGPGGHDNTSSFIKPAQRTPIRIPVQQRLIKPISPLPNGGKHSSVPKYRSFNVQEMAKQTNVHLPAPVVPLCDEKAIRLQETMSFYGLTSESSLLNLRENNFWVDKGVELPLILRKLADKRDPTYSHVWEAEVLKWINVRQPTSNIIAEVLKIAEPSSSCLWKFMLLPAFDRVSMTMKWITLSLGNGNFAKEADDKINRFISRFHMVDHKSYITPFWRQTWRRRDEGV